MFNKLETHSFIIAFIAITSMSWGQVPNITQSRSVVDTAKWYHDFEVDYYPSVKNCHRFQEGGYTDDNGSAFKESIERSLKECTGKDFILERFSGFYMSQAGMEPKVMKENTSIYLNLFASGAIHSVVIKNLKDKDIVEDCLKSTLKNCTVNPAMKDGIHVKSSWSFTIH